MGTCIVLTASHQAAMDGNGQVGCTSDGDVYCGPRSLSRIYLYGLPDSLETRRPRPEPLRASIQAHCCDEHHDNVLTGISKVLSIPRQTCPDSILATCSSHNTAATTFPLTKIFHSPET